MDVFNVTAALLLNLHRARLEWGSAQGQLRRTDITKHMSAVKVGLLFPHLLSLHS